jgi:hypothetical protein
VAKKPPSSILVNTGASSSCITTNSLPGGKGCIALSAKCITIRWWMHPLTSVNLGCESNNVYVATTDPACSVSPLPISLKMTDSYHGAFTMVTVSGITTALYMHRVCCPCGLGSSDPSRSFAKGASSMQCPKQKVPIRPIRPHIAQLPWIKDRFARGGLARGAGFLGFGCLPLLFPLFGLSLPLPDITLKLLQSGIVSFQLSDSSSMLRKVCSLMVFVFELE